MASNFENLDFWKNWINQTPDIIFFKDLQGVYRGVSKSTAVLAGFKSAEEMVGKTDFEIYPEDRAKVFTAQDEGVIKTLEPCFVEDWVIHATKGKIQIETLKAPLYDENGKLLGVQGVSRDITDMYNYKKTIARQQAQMHTIIENIPFPIWLKDVEGRYTLINQSYEKFYQVKKEEVLGLKPLEILKNNNLFAPEETKILEDEDKKVIEEKTISHSTNRMTVDGEEHYLEITKSPILDKNLEVIGIAGISIDVTTHKNYEDELMKARDSAEQANSAKSEFLANISHEIRTPMNGIMGFIQLLAETNLDEEQKDFVDETKKSSEILLKLLNDVLDLSKIEAGKMSMENISFNVRYVVEDVATLASSNVSKKNIEISALCHSNIPEKVFGDPSRLKQVLNNFVNNAIKFTEEGEIVITAKLLEIKDGKVRLIFEVADTGIGISKENQSKIFEAFTQADSSTTRKYGGTGLGLTISKNIIHKMNGEVSIESKPNLGSKFSFTAEFEIDTSPNEYISNYQALKGLTILAVDDNKTNLKILSHYLKEFKATTITATTAEKALEILQNEDQKIDMILTDFCMPEISGIELSQMILKLKKYKNIPIILLTSRAQRGDYRLAMENHLRGYLTKPVRKNDLIECISMLVSENGSMPEEDKMIITKHTIKEKRMNENVKILLAEDNPINQKLTIKMINKAGFFCDLAQNGAEAVTAFENNCYDMIFMDCQMPIMDGYEATAKIREIEKTRGSDPIQIIALTANAMHGIMKDCKKSGMNDYLAKPINYESLIEKINQYAQSGTSHSCRMKKREQISPPKTASKSDIIQSIVSDLGLDASDAEEILNGFLSDAKNMANDMDKALTVKDFDALAQLAHSIKGASGNLRVNDVFLITSKLEEQAKANKIEEIPTLIENVKRIIDEISK